MCKSLTNYFPRNNDFLVTYFGKTQIKSDYPQRFVSICSDNNSQTLICLH